MGQATFSGNGSYRIDVDAALVSQNSTTKTSTIYWRILVIKNGSYGHSGYGSANTGWARSNQGGLWSKNGADFNFQNGSTTGTFTIAEGRFDVKHGADGKAGYSVSAGLNYIMLGSAEAGTGWRTLPTLSRVPEAPTPNGFGAITPTSIQYLFRGNGDGGMPIREWQVHYGLSPTAGQFAATSSGSTVIGNLLPGKKYYFWSRGRNDAGWGPFSNSTSATTLAGARVKVGGVWKDAIPYVKVNGAWKLAQPYSKVNGIWRPTV